jgi:hypothetical protein
MIMREPRSRVFLTLLSNRQDTHTNYISAKYKKAPRRGFFIFGGETGIRTLDTL